MDGKTKGSLPSGINEEAVTCRTWYKTSCSIFVRIVPHTKFQFPALWVVFDTLARALAQ